MEGYMAGVPMDMTMPAVVRRVPGSLQNMSQTSSYPVLPQSLSPRFAQGPHLPMGTARLVAPMPGMIIPLPTTADLVRPVPFPVPTASSSSMASRVREMSPTTQAGNAEDSEAPGALGALGASAAAATDGTPRGAGHDPMTPRIVRPSAMTGSASMSSAALAATFQGVPPPMAQSLLDPMRGIPGTPQQLIEVLAPVATAYRSPMGLNGSFTALPGTAGSLVGSYVPPPQQASMSSFTPPSTLLVQPPRPGLMVGANGLSYAAPMVPRSNSFVPPGPLGTLPQSFSMQVPQVPMSSPQQTSEQAREQLHLTAGMPRPNEIEKQKAAYAKRLDGQMKYEEELLKMTQEQQRRLIYQAAEAEKRQACLAIEQQAKQQELHLQQQCSAQMMGMQQELQSWKLMLERQANELLMEYQQKKSTEELLVAQFDAHQKAHEMEAKLAGRHLHRDEAALPSRG